ncbi:hypothetical protein MTR67_037595 [Solanum verrucosum]|uniref:Protein kinase domain-containing protein n=1 Tax=Solanum verrucosum TaxID=315347 RepID=A0AAF0ZNS7_SOLVR|nr:hypothetical protein MTR67_037595 [Solanum verrucosum]
MRKVLQNLGVCHWLRTSPAAAPLLQCPPTTAGTAALQVYIVDLSCGTKNLWTRDINVTDLESVAGRDIKANNVLLDGELNGRLGDFGLARLYGHGIDPDRELDNHMLALTSMDA